MGKTGKRKLSMEERRAKVNSATAKLDAGVRGISDSEEFKRYLRYVGSFHEYSWGNVMLICRQFPEATLVAGYRDWQRRHRQVRKGEKGISILAPIARKVSDEDEDSEGRAVIGFRTTTVFDISQTDGDPLPERPTPKMLTGETTEAMALFQYLAAYCRKEGVSVDFSLPAAEDGPNGVYDRAKDSISLRADMSADQNAKTLCHEVAHHALHRSERLTRETAEVEAEGTAYVVLSAFGVDADEFSFAYVARWAEKPQILKSALATIQKTADALINDLEDSWTAYKAA